MSLQQSFQSWRGRRLTRVAAIVAVVWLGAAAPPPAADHRGGTLRLVADAAFGSIDPQVNYTSGFAQVFAVVYDGLVAFRKSAGPSSDDVVPDLADALPQPTDNGRTWTFHLRDGVRFSNGAPVTVGDVVASMRRMFAVLSPGTSFLSDIVGADRCVSAPATCTLAGGVSADAGARTVTFHLTAPDPEFLQKMSMQFPSVLPANTPPHDVGTEAAIGTGPYVIAHYAANRQMRFTRNRYFRVWSADAQPDGYADAITYDFGMSDEDMVNAVENDHYDWMYNPPPLDRLGELGADYTARTHVEPVAHTLYLPMNVHAYPFDRLEAREAVNYAIDRRVAVLLAGGPGAATPICQVLPRGFPAAISYCPFTRGADPSHPARDWVAPDLARARALVQASGTAGAHVTIITSTEQSWIVLANYLQDVLRSIGWQVDVRALDLNVEFTYIQNSANKVQIAITDWSADYPAASDFLHVLYGCDSFRPGSDNSINMSEFCDPALDGVSARAEAAMLTDPAAANALWDQLDRAITDRALAANLYQENWIDLVSSRLGDYVFSDISHMIFSKAWVR